MNTLDMTQAQIERIAALVDRGDTAGVRDELVALLVRPHSAGWLRALDAAGLLTRIIPELEPARTTGQPSIHFLPVLAHSIEAVAAVDWLLHELQIVGATAEGERGRQAKRRGRAGDREQPRMEDGG